MSTRLAPRFLRSAGIAVLCSISAISMSACIPQNKAPGSVVQVPGGPPDPGTVIRKAPTPLAQRALFHAYSQLGKTYTMEGHRRLGQRGDGFDCSGFVWWAYTHGGLWMVPGREIWTGSLITDPHLRQIKNVFQMAAGDLIFFGDVNARDGHVAMYLENGWIIDASSGRGQVAVRRISEIRTVQVHSVWRVVP